MLFKLQELTNCVEFHQELSFFFGTLHLYDSHNFIMGTIVLHAVYDMIVSTIYKVKDITKILNNDKNNLRHNHFFLIFKIFNVKN